VDGALFRDDLLDNAARFIDAHARLRAQSDLLFSVGYVDDLLESKLLTSENHCRFSIANCRFTAPRHTYGVSNVSLLTGTQVVETQIGNRQSAIENRQSPTWLLLLRACQGSRKYRSS